MAGLTYFSTWLAGLIFTCWIGSKSSSGGIETLLIMYLLFGWIIVGCSVSLFHHYFFS